MFYDKRQSLEDIYRKLEGETQEFQTQSHLHCKKSCGHCCLNPEIETTVLEMIPVALEIYHRDQTQEVLKKISDRHDQGPCVFYEHDKHFPDRGRCLEYLNRPLICRLFGFSAVKDKHRKSKLVTCKVIKEELAENYKQVVEKIDHGLPVPIMSDYAQQVANIDPGLTAHQLPINLALKRALEKVGLQQNLKEKIL